jgi:hypothetical protein
VVAFTHTAGSADDGPYCEAAAEGNEGLFAESTPYLVEGVFVVKVAIWLLAMMSLQFSWAYYEV